MLTQILKAKCKIIDFRSFHPNDHLGAAHVVNEMYLKDDLLKLPVVAELPTEYNAALRERIRVLVDTVKEALHDGDATEVGPPTPQLRRWGGGGVFDGRDLVVVAKPRRRDPPLLRTISVSDHDSMTRVWW